MLPPILSFRSALQFYIVSIFAVSLSIDTQHYFYVITGYSPDLLDFKTVSFEWNRFWRELFFYFALLLAFFTLFKKRDNSVLKYLLLALFIGASPLFFNSINYFTCLYSIAALPIVFCVYKYTKNNALTKLNQTLGCLATLYFVYYFLLNWWIFEESFDDYFDFALAAPFYTRHLATIFVILGLFRKSYRKRNNLFLIGMLLFTLTTVLDLYARRFIVEFPYSFIMIASILSMILVNLLPALSIITIATCESEQLIKTEGSNPGILDDSFHN